MRCSIAFSALLLAASAFAGEPALVFKQGGAETRRLTVKELSLAVPSIQASVFDEAAGKRKRYRCFPLRGVLNAAYGPNWGKEPFTEAVLTASDGYAAQAQAAKLAEEGGCLAFEDLDASPGWEKVSRKQVDPGPFYLVWLKPEQTSANGYPWPYQLAEFDFIRFEDRYPQVVPRGAAADSPADKGYRLFRAQCLRCHSINREGGKIGPDLNAPQSVTAYRTKKWFKSYVKKPSRYRYTEMPDHPGLSDGDLEALWAYFELKAKQPEKGW